MPDVYRDAEGQPDPDNIRTFDLEVDGEQFAVRVVVDPATGYTDTGYTWLSGPNKGYGFGTGGPPNPSLEEHQQRIRDFLSMVDATTGYIEDGGPASQHQVPAHRSCVNSLYAANQCGRIGAHPSSVGLAEVRSLMDEIVFVVRSEHHPPVGYWSVLDVRINGVRLQELVHTAQVESTYQPGGSSKAAYMGLDPSVASTGHFIGQPVVMSIQGRPVLDRVLLRCTCGEPVCENVTAQVRVDDEHVIWREFRASGDPLDLGPFEFDRSKYEEALQRAATSYESR